MSHAIPQHPAGVGTPRRGFTIIETMVTVAIVAILIAIAVPSMQKLIARKRVAGVAAELASDIRYLRSVGVQTAAQVQIDFGANAAATCYALSTDPYSFGACDCNNPATCDGNSGAPKIVKSVTVPISGGITVAVSNNLTHAAFAGPNSLPINGVTITAIVSSSMGGSVKVLTNAAGRPFACSLLGQESNFPIC